MQIEVRGKLTYVTKLALKRLIDTGHTVHYASDGSNGYAVGSFRYDWTVEGLTALPGSGVGTPRIPLSMALKQIMAA